MKDPSNLEVCWNFLARKEKLKSNKHLSSATRKEIVVLKYLCDGFSVF